MPNHSTRIEPNDDRYQAIWNYWQTDGAPRKSFWQGRDQYMPITDVNDGGETVIVFIHIGSGGAENDYMSMSLSR